MSTPSRDELHARERIAEGRDGSGMVGCGLASTIAPERPSMAYDEDLADRIRRLLRRRRRVSEKKMFGGLCFLVSGNMACGVLGDEICVRVGADAYEKALSRPHAREMDFSGRPLRGIVYVSARGIRADAKLKAWVERGLAHARSLPAK